jgi:hypothetical protein
MASFKDTFAHLPAAQVEVVGSQACQGPTLEGITVGLRQAFAAPLFLDIAPSDGVQGSCEIWWSCDCGSCAPFCGY